MLEDGDAFKIGVERARCRVHFLDARSYLTVRIEGADDRGSIEEELPGRLPWSGPSGRTHPGGARGEKQTLTVDKIEADLTSTTRASGCRRRRPPPRD
jgi:hypothetical protein